MFTSEGGGAEALSDAMGCTEEIGTWENLAPKFIGSKEHTSELDHAEFWHRTLGFSAYII